jgi:hypothetical protein
VFDRFDPVLDMGVGAVSRFEEASWPVAVSVATHW